MPTRYDHEPAGRPSVMARRGGAVGFVLLMAVFSLVCVAVQIFVGAYHADLGTSGDEAGHFVNSLLVYDYVRRGLFTNPMHFALNYYFHWPRVSIGHWPPLFYPIQALAFAVAGRSVATALGVQALVAGAAAGWAAWLAWRRLGWMPGLATGAVVLASPFLLYSVDLIMVDTALGLWLLAAALTWGHFARRPGLGRAILFAFCASCAILTKGNGIALVLLPPLHAALTRNPGPLRDWRAWIAALLVGLATAPWYVLTYRMAAGGFVYAWGWHYTRLAVPYYLLAFPGSVGALGVVGVIAGLVGLVRRTDGWRDDTPASLAALVLAVLIFQMIAPADLLARYLIALVPAGAVLAALGLAALVRGIGRDRHPTLATVAVAVLLLLDAASMFRMPHVSPYGMGAIAHRIITAHDANVTVLAAGDDHAEAALIAAFAVEDPAQKFYVLRASQELATTNFMGSHYAARFAHAAEVTDWLRDSGIGWLVIGLSHGSLAMRHDRELLDSLRMPGAPWTLVADPTGPHGEVLLYRLSRRPVTQGQVHALLRRVMPSTLSH
ncbi:MAG: ArnT family glycosyltransferase [Acetobacteraceae bacterium]